MKIAVLSDIHGNLPAMQAVANRISEKFFVLIEDEEEVCIQSSMSPEEMLFHLVAIQERIKSQMAPHLRRKQ